MCLFLSAVVVRCHSILITAVMLRDVKCVTAARLTLHAQNCADEHMRCDTMRLRNEGRMKRNPHRSPGSFAVARATFELHFMSLNVRFTVVSPVGL